MRAGTVWVPAENPLAGALECLVGLNGFEKRDPGRVVIDFGMARVSGMWYLECGILNINLSISKGLFSRQRPKAHLSTATSAIYVAQSSHRLVSK